MKGQRKWSVRKSTGETYICLANTISLFQWIKGSMHVEIQYVSIEWGSALVWMELQMRYDGRFEKYALASGRTKVIDRRKLITQA
jgi:hypothetical protein